MLKNTPKIVLIFLVAITLIVHSSAEEQKKFYDPVVKKLEGWSIKVDPKLLEKEHEKFMLEVFDALANHLQRIKYILPDERVKELQQLPICVL